MLMGRFCRRESRFFSSYFFPRPVWLACVWRLEYTDRIYSAGGLTIIGGNGKIDINNTFEERLRLLKENALPAVRQTLFGKNENRKFYD